MTLSKVLATATAVVLASTLFPSTVLAQGNSQGKGKSKEATTSKGTPDTAKPKVEIPKRDRDEISKYYTDHPPGLPPGLAKRTDGLPPGLEKQLQRNGSLPPGLEKRLEPFPGDLRRRLTTKLPSGYEWFLLGPHAVALDRQKNLIGDVFLNAVR